MKKTVLIVDDERDIHTLLNGFLQKRKYVPVNAYSIKDALKLLGSYILPDYALLDYNLPDGKGTDLIPHLKKAFPKIKIAVITANKYDAQSSLVQQKSHPDVFFEKPFSPKRIESDFFNEHNY